LIIYLILVLDDAYRIATLMSSFEKFPEAASVDPILLAYSGFSYTGPGDRVVCSR